MPVHSPHFGMGKMINAEHVAVNHFAHKHYFEREGTVLQYTGINFHLFVICNDQKLKKIECFMYKVCALIVDT